jgi:hypothetical protein
VIATFTVTKTAASTLLNATVEVQTANGTATAGTDYTAVALTTLTFLPSETTKQVAVTVSGDTTFEPNETFFVNLTNPTNATITDNQGVGTINNDDSGNTAPVAVNDTATTALLTPVTINVLSNDTDDKGVIASTVAQATAPTNGSISINATTGTITYSPDLGFSGTDQFTYTVQDLEGEVSNAATVTVTVNRGDANAIITALVPDPNNPGETALVIVDRETGGGLRVVERGGDVVVLSGLFSVVGRFDPTGSIIIMGGGGDDNIRIGNNLDRPVIIDGGAGDDRLRSGSGPAVLVGGAGNDRLTAGRGRNILIGGDGADVLKGGNLDDILIGGTTQYDSDAAALDSLREMWNVSGASYTQRINSIVNGPYPLNLVTVLSDGDADILGISRGNDWFFVNDPNDRLKRGFRLLDPSQSISGFGTTVVPNTIVKL